MRSWYCKSWLSESWSCKSWSRVRTLIVLVCWLESITVSWFSCLPCPCLCKVRSRISDTLSQALCNLSLASLADFTILLLSYFSELSLYTLLFVWIEIHDHSVHMSSILQAQLLYTAGIPLLEAYLLPIANNRTCNERLSQEQSGREPHGQSSKFIYLIRPTWAYRIQQQTDSNMHTQMHVIVQQCNIMSTQVVSGVVTSGGNGDSWEYSSKLRHGHLRHDSIHTLRYHRGTETKLHWPLFLISSQGRGLPHKHKHWHYTS